MDKIKNGDSFERMLFATFAYETTPVGGKCSYSAETFIASLAGELNQAEEDRLSAHLLLCPTCAKEYASIERSLQQDEERLFAQARVPSLVEHVRQKRQKKRGWRVLISRFPIREQRLPAFLAASAAALIIALAVIIPLHYLPGESAVIIPADGQFIAKGEPTIASTTTVVTELTPGSLVDRLDSMAGYEPWRAMAFIIGYLRATGVPLESASLAFDHQTTYTTESGDTWRMVAKKTLGNSDLWPIIILLNHNRTQHGEFPPVGTLLRVPALEAGSK